MRKLNADNQTLKTLATFRNKNITEAVFSLGKTRQYADTSQRNDNKGPQPKIIHKYNCNRFMNLQSSH